MTVHGSPGSSPATTPRLERQQSAPALLSGRSITALLTLSKLDGTDALGGGNGQAGSLARPLKRASTLSEIYDPKKNDPDTGTAMKMPSIEE